MNKIIEDCSGIYLMKIGDLYNGRKIVAIHEDCQYHMEWPHSRCSGCPRIVYQGNGDPKGTGFCHKFFDERLLDRLL
jgi:hypothetical protein